MANSFIYPKNNPSDILEFQYHPDKHTEKFRLLGGDSDHPTRGRSVSQLTGRASPTFTFSTMWDSLDIEAGDTRFSTIPVELTVAGRVTTSTEKDLEELDREFDAEDDLPATGPAGQAYSWIVRNIGPRGRVEPDVAPIFVLKLIGQPTQVRITDVDVDHEFITRPTGGTKAPARVLRFRANFSGTQFFDSVVDTRLFNVVRKAKRRKKPSGNKPSTESTGGITASFRRAVAAASSPQVQLAPLTGTVFEGLHDGLTAVDHRARAASLRQEAFAFRSLADATVPQIAQAVANDVGAAVVSEVASNIPKAIIIGGTAVAAVGAAVATAGAAAGPILGGFAGIAAEAGGVAIAGAVALPGAASALGGVVLGAMGVFDSTAGSDATTNAVVDYNFFSAAAQQRTADAAAAEARANELDPQIVPAPSGTIQSSPEVSSNERAQQALDVIGFDNPSPSADERQDAQQIFRTIGLESSDTGTPSPEVSALNEKINNQAAAVLNTVVDTASQVVDKVGTFIDENPRDAALIAVGAALTGGAALAVGAAASGIAVATGVVGAAVVGTAAAVSSDSTSGEGVDTTSVVSNVNTAPPAEDPSVSIPTIYSSGPAPVVPDGPTSPAGPLGSSAPPVEPAPPPSDFPGGDADDGKDAITTTPRVVSPGDEPLRFTPETVIGAVPLTGNPDPEQDTAAPILLVSRDPNDGAPAAIETAQYPEDPNPVLHTPGVPSSELAPTPQVPVQTQGFRDVPVTNELYTRTLDAVFGFTEPLGPLLDTVRALSDQQFALQTAFPPGEAPPNPNADVFPPSPETQVQTLYEREIALLNESEDLDDGEDDLPPPITPVSLRDDT